MEKNNIKYYIVKDQKDKSITYFEYDKIDGYNITPKNNVKIKDAINVNKMVIINPTMINKMIMKKLNKKFEKLLKFLTIIFEEDDDTGSSYIEALNEIEKLRMEMMNKYKVYLEQQEVEVFLKKLGILESELRLRIDILKNKLYEQEKTRMEGKSR